MNYKYIVVMFIAMTGQCYAMVREQDKNKGGYSAGCLRDSRGSNKSYEFDEIQERSYEKVPRSFDEYFYGAYLDTLAAKYISQCRQQPDEQDCKGEV